MKLKETGAIIIVFILVCAGVVGWVSSRFLGPDAIPEEIAESILEDQFGLPDGSVDFTPGSPEELQEKLIDRYLQKNA